MNSLFVLRPAATALILATVACTAPAPQQAAGVDAAPVACRLPASVTPAPQRRPPADEIVSDEPTAFYMLALTWSPETCRSQVDDPDFANQCQANDFGFVLHGLWPNGAARRHPRYCGPAPEISATTVRRHSCMTPTPVTLQHEWAAHGTCGWETPEAYFAQAALLWDGLKKPDLTASTLTAGQIRDAFVAINPQLKRGGIYIKTADRVRLEDVRFCYDLAYRPMTCPSIGAPDDVAVTILPRRAG